MRISRARLRPEATVVARGVAALLQIAVQHKRYASISAVFPVQPGSVGGEKAALNSRLRSVVRNVAWLRRALRQRTQERRSKSVDIRRLPSLSVIPLYYNCIDNANKNP